jgi:hypothetical protein
MSISVGKTNITVQQNNQLFSPVRKPGSSRKPIMLNSILLEILLLPTIFRGKAQTIPYKPYDSWPYRMGQFFNQSVHMAIF